MTLCRDHQVANQVEQLVSHIHVRGRQQMEKKTRHKAMVSYARPKIVRSWRSVL